MATTVRVHELAKELNLSSKETIALLSKVGIRASTHMSVIDEHRARIVKGVLLGNLAQAAKTHKPVAKSATGNGAAAPKQASVSAAASAEAAAPPAPKTEVRPQVAASEAPAAAAASSVQPAPKVSAEPPPPALKPVPSGQRSAARPVPAHKVIPAASASPSTPVPAQARAVAAPARQDRPQARPLGAPQQAGAGTAVRPPLRRDGFLPGRPMPGRQAPGRPLPGRPGAGPGAPLPATGPAPSTGGRKRSREDLERDRKEREREELLKKTQPRHKAASVATPTAEPVVFKDLEIPDLITVQQLAAAMSVPAGQVIAQLIRTGTMATINQHIAPDVASQVARRFGFNTIVKEAGEEAAEIVVDSDPAGSLTPRPPVVTVLGHVDHGKTSLLDAIRSTKVAAGEAGGITQRIGAYTVETGERKVTFIDTPGHEAFTEMRARGAKVTDVAILVVAADDGVMPQTIEAMNHARAASVPIVVAVNKVDKPNANVDRVKQQLSEYGLTPEDWGGTTQFIPVSAKQRTGIDELLEMVLLNADLLELKANKNRRAQGVIIEAQLDRSRGPVATVLVKNGTLRVGDIVVVGSTWGRVRALFDDKLQAIKRAGPAIPAEIMGLSDVPAAGDVLEVVSDERDARELAAKRSQRKREQRMASTRRAVTLDGFLAQAKEGGQRELNLIIKADAQGSVEALRSQLDGLANEEVRTRVIHTGVGGINESDVMLASASNAIIIGFDIRPDATITRKAETEGVDVRLYDVIYNVIDEVKAAMTGMLKPQTREVVQGQAEVRQIFKVSKVGTIAGCYVKSGKVTRDSRIRLLRDSVVVYEGKLASLKRFKDDVREVAEGYECGMAIENFNDIKEGDVFEAFTTEQFAPAGAA